MGVGEWKSRAHPFPLITGFCICHFIDISENEKEMQKRWEECFALPLFFMLFSGLHIMIVKRKRMENRKYLVARSPFVK